MKSCLRFALAAAALLAAPMSLAQPAAGSGGQGAATPAGGDLPGGGFDRALFDLWIDARAGTGEPVWWYSEGTLHAFPSGELIARVEGFDTARMHWPDRAVPDVHQYSRKIYMFRDPATGQVLRQFNGNAVAPIAFPYQFIRYRLQGDDIATVVEQGVAPNVMTIPARQGITARRLGNDGVAFTAPLYMDFPSRGGARFQAFENYDFFISTNPAVSEPHQLSWVRFGPAPAWAGGVPSVMHLVTWRVERFEDLPAPMRSFIEAEAPMWKAPPVDLADIRRLQAGG
jgi:hypothetical protein